MGIGQIPPLSSAGFVKSHWAGTTIRSVPDASPAAAKLTLGAAISLKPSAVRPMEYGAYVNLTVAPLAAAFPRLRIRARQRFIMPCFAFTTLFALSTTKISGDCHAGPCPVTEPEGVMARSAPTGSVSVEENTP